MAQKEEMRKRALPRERIITRELTYLMPYYISQTHVCLMVNLVLLNLTLFLIAHFHAMHGYAATHICTPHVHAPSSILPPPHDCIMSLISIMPALDHIGRFNTNMHILYDSIQEPRN